MLQTRWIQRLFVTPEDARDRNSLHRRAVSRSRPGTCPALEKLEPRMMLAGPGTELSLKMISDIDPMIPGGRGGTTSLTQLEGRLYFPGMGDNGMELYAYDPQTDRTFEVADINPAGDSNPGFYIGLSVFDDRLFFDADGPDGNELHAYDPQTGIVSQIADINPNGNSVPGFGTVVDGRLLFPAIGTNGRELFEYDPNDVDNPLREYDINETGSSGPIGFETLIDGRVVFTARGPFGEEPYLYDPQTREVKLLADINPSTTESSNFANLQPFDGLLFFTARQGNRSSELFALDPNTDEIIEFDVDVDGTSFAPFGDRLYFTDYSRVYAYDANTKSIELVTSNFLANGLGSGRSAGIYQDRLFFSIQGNEEYSDGVYSYDSDGVLEQLVDPLLDGMSYAGDFYVFDDQLFFTVARPSVYQDGGYWDEQIFAYDGATEQLRKFDLNPAGSSNPSLLSDPVFEDLLLYRELRSNGVEIFAYDPATSSVREVADVNPEGDATPWRFTRFDDRLFFVAAGADGFRVFALERQLPPVATNDTAATDEDFAVAIDVLANDMDPNDDAVTVTTVTQPANGSVALNADGTLTYTPDTDFHGSDSFIYTIDDGHCGTSTATVNVTVVAAQQQIPILVNEVEVLGRPARSTRAR